MKKLLLSIFIFSQSNFCNAQTAFNCSTSFNHNDLIGKIFLNSSKKKKIFQGDELTFKTGVHISNMRSNHFTTDDFSCKSIAVGMPSPFMHYLYIPQSQTNFYLTNKFFLFNKFLFVEAGIQKTSWSSEIKKVEGSHIYNDTLFDCYWYEYDSTLESITRLKNTYHYFEIPLQVGIEWKRISFSIGFTRIIDKVFVVKKFTSDSITISLQNFFLDKPYTDNVHGQINLSVALINKKIKLSPFIISRFDRLSFSPKYHSVTVGIELGYKFEDKN